VTTHECVHLVTGSYFQSRNKDGDHAMCLTVTENPMLHAHFTALCVIDAQLLVMKFSTCEDPDLC